ncbi:MULTISPECIES: hypothetical protein [Streptomyces]|nr:MULTISPECIES: hypothetical protein [Streptomyces]
MTDEERRAAEADMEAARARAAADLEAAQEAAERLRRLLAGTD